MNDKNEIHAIFSGQKYVRTIKTRKKKKVKRNATSRLVFLFTNEQRNKQERKKKKNLAADVVGGYIDDYEHDRYTCKKTLHISEYKGRKRTGKKSLRLE